MWSRRRGGNKRAGGFVLDPLACNPFRFALTFVCSHVQRSKPGPDASENKFTGAERGTKDNTSVNGDVMDVAVSPAGGASRPSDRNGDEDQHHDDAGVDMHAGAATSHGGWS